MLKPYNRAELTFDLEREIGGDGQNSRTFVAKDHQLDAQIVIKQVAKAKLASPENFFDEAKALYASAHPNVVPIFYGCFDADCIFLGMPFYKRGSLHALMLTKHLTVREIIVFSSQILTGLHNIHSKGLIHFDVRPNNVLLSDRGEALLSDFGLAKQMNLEGVALQDRIYFKTIAPEGLTGDEFTRAFDIYQFGLTLYRMCNGEESFAAQFQKYGTGANFDRADFRYACGMAISRTVTTFFRTSRAPFAR
jgi:serine/threonine protein kinase